MYICVSNAQAPDGFVIIFFHLNYKQSSSSSSINNSSCYFWEDATFECVYVWLNPTRRRHRHLHHHYLPQRYDETRYQRH